MAKTKIKVRSITIKKSEQAREKGLTDEEAKSKIESLRKAVLSGEQFEVLASEQSEDYQAAQGGLSDWMEPGAMIPVIEDVIFNLKKGEVSKVIESAMGYHFFRVEDKMEGKEIPFEAMRNSLYDRIYHEKIKKRFDDWLEGLKQSAYISIR